MNAKRWRIFSRAVPICLALGGFADSAGADRLTASLYADSVLLYELIVVHVELHLDEAFVPPEMLDDPYEANRQLHRLRRRLKLELRGPGEEKISKGILVLEFPRPSEPARVLAATGLGFLGWADPKTDEFHHWTRPGVFKLVVVDRGNDLESNEMRITFKVLSGRELEGGRLFKKCGVDAIASLVGEQLRHSESAVLFRRLAAEYPETMYGKYAVAALVLLRWKDTFREHNIKGGENVWGPVTDELAKAATLFNRAHPLRERVLFHLARAQIFAGQSREARRTAEIVSRDFPNGECGRKAKDMLAKLDD